MMTFKAKQSRKRGSRNSMGPQWLVINIAKANFERGIISFRDNIADGVHTPLADAYRDDILKPTNIFSFDEAQEKVRAK